MYKIVITIFYIVVIKHSYYLEEVFYSVILHSKKWVSVACRIDKNINIYVWIFFFGTNSNLDLINKRN